MKDFYNTIIIGGGPAAYTASIYLSRYKIDNLIIGNLSGGRVFTTTEIENYPGFINITGPDLTKLMADGAKKWQGEFLTDTVTKIDKENNKFVITTQLGKIINTNSIIIATGTKYRKLGLEKEEGLLGRGVAYCATCDGMFFRDKVVAVVGGSDSANKASLYLSKIAKKVYQIYRGDTLRGDKIWIENLHKKDNVEIIYNTNVIELIGENKLEKIKLDNKYNDSDSLETDGIFIEIGSSPTNQLAKDLNIELDDAGYIKVKQNQRTNIDGIWAAGDVTNGSNGFRQIITACSEGAIAAGDIEGYISKLKTS